ncbi:MAG: ABC transporter ATP-binding protein [Pseudomonadales bacterium]|nr:ABC transporter ATP-binding protein [Pseudomonadales bacterium]
MSEFPESEAKAETECVLECKNLSKSFRQGPERLVVIDHINLCVKPGEHLAILGRSGSGKSTLLHLLGGLTDSDTGQVMVGGQNLTQSNASQRARIRNKKMGFVYQFHHLLPEFNALENVAMPLLLGNAKPKLAYQRAEEMLESVDLLNRAKHRQAELSGGERQRVAIARALVTQPKIVLADEPTGNLDGESAAQIFQLMRDLSERCQTAFVIVTHDEAMAESLHRKLRIVDGRFTDPND